MAPERAASVLCHSGVHLPGKDASFKCFDAVLGKVHLPCLRFIAVRIVPEYCILVSTLPSCARGMFPSFSHGT